MVFKGLISAFFTIVFLSTMMLSFCAAVHGSLDISIEVISGAEDIENSGEAERPFGESESEDSKNESKTETDEFLSTHQKRESNTSVLADLKFIEQHILFEMLFLEIPNPPPQI
ncbi:MAG: hypothetical protein HC811_06755 [Flammeovirgaceae bacterium]|nr:hypothetical protein [Flammeovirgaceae bacterium]